MLRLFMIVLWPSFLVAIVAEGLLFSVIDALHLSQEGGRDEVWSLATYTIGFLLLWLFCALSSALTCYLGCPPPKQVQQTER